MQKYTGPHDYFDPAYVDAWAEIANTRRPHRARFFDAFVKELSRLAKPKVLELGAGPAFLAERLLISCDLSSYHLLDFSPRMLELARARLASFGDRVFFYQLDLVEEDWWQSLPAGFDAILSLQAIHDVGRPEKISELYKGAAALLVDGGRIIIADKMEFVTAEETGHLSIEDHEKGLKEAGFVEFRRLLEVEDLIMFEAIRPAARPVC